MKDGEQLGTGTVQNMKEEATIVKYLYHMTNATVQVPNAHLSIRTLSYVNRW